MDLANLLLFLPACVVIAVTARDVVKDEKEDVERLSQLEETNRSLRECRINLEENGKKLKDSIAKLEAVIELRKAKRAAKLPSHPEQ